MELADLVDSTFGTAPGYWSLMRCVDCGTAYLDPRPDQRTIHLAYSNYYTHSGAAPARALNRMQWLQRAIGNAYRNRLFGTDLQPAIAMGALLAPLFPRARERIRTQGRGLERLASAGGRVLDIGCGNGEFLLFAREMGWEAFGVELDEVAARLASAQGVRVVGRDIADLRETYPAFFDAVTMSQVIEHVPDPFVTLQDCHTAMKPGARLWIETPNMDSVGYETYGRFWRGLEAPRHLSIFNLGSLSDLMRRAGFRDIRALPSRDVTRDLMMASAAMESGQLPSAGRPVFPSGVRRKLRREIRLAREIARRQPDRSEFLTVTGIRAAP